MVKPKFVHGAPLVNSPSPRLDLGGRSNGSGTGSAEGNGRDVDGYEYFGAIHLRKRMGSGSSGDVDASVDGGDGDGEDTRSPLRPMPGAGSGLINVNGQMSRRKKTRALPCSSRSRLAAGLVLVLVLKLQARIRRHRRSQYQHLVLAPPIWSQRSNHARPPSRLNAAPNTYTHITVYPIHARPPRPPSLPPLPPPCPCPSPLTVRTVATPDGTPPSISSTSQSAATRRDHARAAETMPTCTTRSRVGVLGPMTRWTWTLKGNSRTRLRTRVMRTRMR